jgi:NAD(P)H-hydrate epimerase
VSGKLLSAGAARALDAEAQASWGLPDFALVEAAGRRCARVFTKAYAPLFAPPPRVTAAAGSGNNGADALVMLRALILRGAAAPGASAAVINRPPGGEEHTPRSEALRSLKAMGVPALVWEADSAACLAALEGADIIIDGIAGTGLEGPLRGTALEMAAAVNALGSSGASGGECIPAGSAGRPFVVSVDIPSGGADSWRPGMAMVKAGATLAIEPAKEALYKPAARLFAGTVLPVGGIFPPALIGRFEGPCLINRDEALGAVPPVRPDAYKYERGVVEIRAGSPGSAGAARIAARGAQAAGAGLVRLVTDDSVYPVLAAGAGGVMVVPGSSVPPDRPDGRAAGRFKPDAVLLGPGWGGAPDRPLMLRNALAGEAEGTPLILDADAISLSRDIVFHGKAILTPHPGEFAALTGIPREEVLACPGPVLTRAARERQGVILFKSHVLIIAAPDGRLGYLDGMAPALAAGGSGDLLAGICAALAARTARAGVYDGYTCAAAAAALLVKSAEAADTFIDPLDLADRTAGIAGAAWLPGDYTGKRITSWKKKKNR